MQPFFKSKYQSQSGFFRMYLPLFCLFNVFPLFFLVSNLRRSTPYIHLWQLNHLTAFSYKVFRASPHPIQDITVVYFACPFSFKGAIMTDEQILEKAESTPLELMGAFIADVREGNPSIWLLKKLYDLWEDKRNWRF